MASGSVLDLANNLAERFQELRAGNESLAILTGSSSSQIAMQHLRTTAAQLVFELRNDGNKERLQETVEALESNLYAIQLYGTINAAEFEKYIRIVDEIHSLIDKER